MDRLNEQVGYLEKMMDICSLKQKTIASNIANIDTPGYKTKKVVFLDELISILESNTDEPEKNSNTRRDISAGESGIEGVSIQTVEDGAIKNDLNNVDLDKQMVEMSMNNLMFRTSSILLSKQFELI